MKGSGVTVAHTPKSLAAPEGTLYSPHASSNPKGDTGTLLAVRKRNIPLRDANGGDKC
jgi:hypothetical protein